ncbi:MAG: hypothetical protein AAF553_07125 [Pseudomonadota bacterium]
MNLTISHESVRRFAQRQNTAAGNDNEHERAYALLAADEVQAVVENLEDCVRLTDGIAGRRVPETLCLEIESLLKLLSREFREAMD